MRRLLDLLTFGRMVERMLNEPPSGPDCYGEVYFRDEGTPGRWLRVDGCWPLTPAQVRAVRRAGEQT